MSTEAAHDVEAHVQTILTAVDRQPVDVEERVRLSPVALDTVTTRRRLRRYVQVHGVERVFFKAFGDPRTASNSTGEVFPDATALLRARPDEGPATSSCTWPSTRRRRVNCLAAQDLADRVAAMLTKLIRSAESDDR